MHTKISQLISNGKVTMIGMVYHSEIVISIGEMLKKKKDLPPIDCTTFQLQNLVRLIIWLDWKLSLTQTQFYTIYLVVVSH